MEDVEEEDGECGETESVPVSSKKECSEKMKAHLNKIRVLALEKKKEQNALSNKAKSLDKIKKEKKAKEIEEKAKEYDEMVAKQQQQPEEEEEYEEEEYEEEVAPPAKTKAVAKPVNKPVKPVKQKIVYEEYSTDDDDDEEEEEEIIIRRPKAKSQQGYAKLLNKTAEQKLREKYMDERIKSTIQLMSPMRYGY